jgi:hypothetical protein
MTDSNAASIFDPKSQCLRDLLIQPFWEHLSTGSDWKKHIKQVLEDSTKEAIEQDNHELQEELKTANDVIAEQQLRIKRMEDYIKKMHHANRNAREAIDSAYNSLGSMQGMSFL